MQYDLPCFAVIWTESNFLLPAFVQIRLVPNQQQPPKVVFFCYVVKTIPSKNTRTFPYPNESSKNNKGIQVSLIMTNTLNRSYRPLKIVYHAKKKICIFCLIFNTNGQPQGYFRWFTGCYYSLTLQNTFSPAVNFKSLKTLQSANEFLGSFNSNTTYCFQQGCYLYG